MLGTPVVYVKNKEHRDPDHKMVIKNVTCIDHESVTWSEESFTIVGEGRTEGKTTKNIS